MWYKCLRGFLIDQDYRLMGFVHVFSLNKPSHGQLLWSIMYILMTTSLSAWLIPSPMLFANSKVKLRWKILEKQPYVLSTSWTYCRRHIFTFDFVHSKHTQVFINGCGSPTKFINVIQLLDLKKDVFRSCNEGWLFGT